MFKFLLLLIISSIHLINANPFAIQYVRSETLTNQDYIDIQEQLRKIDLKALLQELYPENQGYSARREFENRCTIGLRGTLIDPINGIYPIMQLEKIGEGSENCVVTYASWNGNYPHFIYSLLKGLRESGFHGYIWYRIGGYPNPTGKEIQFAGVPYAFKIAMMQEANQMGFNRVLWLDSAMIPLQDPTFYFQRIEEEGAYFCRNELSTEHKMKYTLPKARQSIKDLIDTDVVQVESFKGAIFGFQMNSTLGHQLLHDYYMLVENGYAFLSCFPEEFAIAAILSKPAFINWKPKWRWEDQWLLWGAGDDLYDSLNSIQRRREEGMMFYHRAGKNFIEGLDNSNSTQLHKSY